MATEVAKVYGKENPQLVLGAACHDFSEALCGDVTTPLKRQLSEYRAIESAVEERILAHFQVTLSELEWGIIKQYDLAALETESKVFKDKPINLSIVGLPQLAVPLEWRIPGLSRATVKTRFRALWKHYGGNNKQFSKTRFL